MTCFARVVSSGLPAPATPGLKARNRANNLRTMLRVAKPPLLRELRTLLRSFCEKHGIRRLDIFGSAARGLATPDSDVDMLVSFDESKTVSTADLLEMAGEAEELVGVPVDFVLRQSLERSPNRFAREHILASAVCVYGS